MARRITPVGPVPVESIAHNETRTNIPTADAQEFVDPASERLEPIRYRRDPSLDPQLVWRGKDEQDSADLVVDAPPIYIQEKIDPRVLIENLRRTADEAEDEPELTLFDDFDGLDELSQAEFYGHDAKWSNRMILGDSLQAMASLAEREHLRGKVQMIYIDPPYGIKFGSNWQVSARKRDVKDGKLDDAAREAEQIKAFRDTWAGGIHSYLSYLRDRLLVARDLLTESGSCFVQIGDENVHLVRSLMDEVFGSENFATMITLRKTHTAGSPSGGTDVLASVSDYILWYGRNFSDIKYRQLYEERSGFNWVNYDYVLESTSHTRRITKEEKTGADRLPPGSRVYRRSPLTSSSSPESARFVFNHEGGPFRPGRGGWKTNTAGMARLSAANRLEAYGQTLAFRRYTDDFPYFPRSNLWTDTARGGYGEDQIYVVQTGTKVVQRCMLMCTDPGDLVLDPTCGSGTTSYVAEQWGRRWITMDTSRVALTLARQRLMTAKYPYYLLADTPEGRAKEAAVSGRPAASQGATTNDIRHGFVYERVQHITLKSIANNPDIREGMSRAEIDAAIKRHADFEYLYDRPYEDKKKVRVTGPFTVESLSPYRSVSFDEVADHTPRTESEARTDPENPSFERSILDNLAKAGIQNGQRGERIEFASLESHAGTYVQAIGDRADSRASQAPSRVALAIGPQYGTIDGKFIKAAAREALADPNVDLLCVLGFAFEPTTGVSSDDDVTVNASTTGFASVATERRLGRMPVLLVRMNADLLMGEDLKKTGAGNLFTVFGEPDIELQKTPEGRIIVDLRGVDIYNPTTGQVTPASTGQIALWMIDTDYNGESFFVRHCYFTGGNDPYKRLKTALKADIDADAWASLYRTASRPFSPPSTGHIAVKVINDYGDEVMKVFPIE